MGAGDGARWIDRRGNIFFFFPSRNVQKKMEKHDAKNLIPEGGGCYRYSRTEQKTLIPSRPVHIMNDNGGWLDMKHDGVHRTIDLTKIKANRRRASHDGWQGKRFIHGSWRRR